MTVKEYAEYRSVSRPTVYTWIRKGLIIRDNAGNIDPAQANAQTGGEVIEAPPPDKAPEAEAMTVAEYATHRGVHKQTIYDGLKSGTIERMPNGKLNVEMCDLAWRARIRPEATIATPSAAPPFLAAIGAEGDADADEALNYSIERARHEHYKANLAEIKFREAAGSLLPVKSANELAFEAFRTARARFEGIPAKIAASLSAETELHAIKTILEAEIHDVLDRLAEDIESTVINEIV